ncbi:MAG: phosphatidylglycerophosphatase A [Candidatus Omnitrophica bacterium]|nr:phosphatidylglycerophosphatase A [Candidatus Omnitrophota bacterium]
MASDRWVKMLSTFFYVGYSPVAPGSMASVVAVLMSFCLQANLLMYIAVLIVVTIAGFFISDRMESLEGQKDPSCIVIDEVSGVMIAFLGLPWNWPVVITTFFLFRAFDMFKVYPVNKLEGMKGGVGVMMDDVVAGIYTNLVMQVAIRFAGIV